MKKYVYGFWTTEGSTDVSTLSKKKKKKKKRMGERSSDVAHEEEPDFGGNMASPAGCKHYVRSCLLKVSELFRNVLYIFALGACRRETGFEFATVTQL